MASLRNKIKKHALTMSFMLIIVLFFSIGTVTIRGLFTLGTLTKTIYQHPLVVSNASLIAALNITKMHRSFKDAVLADTPEELKIALKSVSKNEQKVYAQLDIIREKILGEEGRVLEKQTRQFFADWEPIRKEAVMLLESGNRKDAIRITKKRGTAHVAKLETTMLELTAYARKKADGFLERTETNQARLEKITLVLTLSGIVLSILIACIATRLVAQAEKLLQEEKSKLQIALDEIKTLRGIIPICSHCKQIRDAEGLWKTLEEYIHAHSDARFSHTICPDCARKYYPEFYDPGNPGEKEEK